MPGVTLTPRWLVISRRRRFAVRRLDELVWAFPRVTTVRLHGAIPVWRTHAVVVRSAAGPDVEAPCSKAACARVLDALARRSPWILVGHDDAREAAWTSDRAAFTAAVLKRP